MLCGPNRFTWDGSPHHFAEKKMDPEEEQKLREDEDGELATFQALLGQARAQREMDLIGFSAEINPQRFGFHQQGVAMNPQMPGDVGTMAVERLERGQNMLAFEGPGGLF